MVFLCKNGWRSDNIWEKVKEGGGKNFLKKEDFAPKTFTKQEVGLKSESSYRMVIIRAL